MDRKTIILFIGAFLIIGMLFIEGINFSSLATDSGFDTSYSGGGGGGRGHSSSSSSSSRGSSRPLTLPEILITIGVIVGAIVFFVGTLYFLEYLEKKHLATVIVFVFSLIILIALFSLLILVFIVLALSIQNLIGKIIMLLLLPLPLTIYLIQSVKKMWNREKGSIKVDRILRKLEKDSLPLTKEDEKVLQKGYQIYLDVQKAWMNFDYDTMRLLVTDELFNMYQNQLKTLELKEQQNIMKNFKLKEYHLVSRKNENGVTTIVVLLKTAFFDYIINKEKEVVRGRENRKVTMTYLLTFVSADKKIERCPNCGAQLEKESTECTYCNTKIQKNAKMKLAKKEALKQE